MSTVTGLTAERMLAIEAASVVGGAVNGSGHLILTKHDSSTIDSGSVIGPTGSPGVSQGQLDTFMLDHLPIGSVVDYMGTTSPSAKWLMMTGQTVTGAQSAYPTWWALIPTSMKSGANAIMPNTKGKVSVGYDATDTDFDVIGETGGEKTHQLTQAELPNATITINPPSTAVTGSTSTDGQHGHDLRADNSPSVGLQQFAGHTDGQSGNQIGNSSAINDGTYEAQPAGAHFHGPGTFAVDIPQFNSGALGSGSAHNNVQPYVVFCKLVKVL